MTYPDAVRYLLSLLGDIRGANFGLQRMSALMERLGSPQRAYRVVHIAGTNGKGSTAAMIEAGLRAAGHTTGLYRRI
jgi:dihydrofolate synthase / folylpolyglutamate synthase